MFACMCVCVYVYILPNHWWQASALDLEQEHFYCWGVYVCMFVCVYVNIYVCIHVYTSQPPRHTHTYIHIHIHTYIHTSDRPQHRQPKWPYIRWMWGTHTYIHTYIHPHTHIHLHTYIHPHTHTYIRSTPTPSAQMILHTLDARLVHNGSQIMCTPITNAICLYVRKTRSHVLSKSQGIYTCVCMCVWCVCVCVCVVCVCVCVVCMCVCVCGVCVHIYWQWTQYAFM